ncbi:Smr/MutS family protein [Paracoccus sp. (in: a-proteobacteria)]|uniref:Smr/MutS family protein n=1 Tax=Paracoccus sp. TaxID=267 RepID=UPI00321F9FB7
MARRRRLSAEEEALWSRVAATAQPLHPARPDPLPAPPPAEPPARPTAKPSLAKPSLAKSSMAKSRPAPAPLLPPDLRITGKAGRSATRIDLAPAAPEVLRGAALRMDHKTHRQMTRGKVAPDARIDLHGLTLSAAQPVLTRFVLQAHAQGRRLLLVITGKGRQGDSWAPLPIRPGALRHNVPHWLGAPPLAGVVLQVRPAHRRHGGEGAYYVYLRRRPGDQP